MRPGDNIDNFKGKWWVITHVMPISHLCPDFRSGRWALLASLRFMLDGGNQVVLRLEHEDDIRSHWSRGPSFADGQIIKDYRHLGDDVRIHYVDDTLATLVDGTGEFVPEMRWRLAFRIGAKTHIDFETIASDDTPMRADHLGAVDA